LPTCASSATSSAAGKLVGFYLEVLLGATVAESYGWKAATPREDYHGASAAVLYGRKAAPPPLEVHHGATVAVLVGRRVAPPS
jgi:hypothetical protein